MLVARWILAVVLAAMGAFVIFANAVGVSRATREHGYSSIPLLGGGFVALALVALPIARVHPWCWLPLVLDPFSVPMVLLAIAFYVRRRGE